MNDQEATLIYHIKEELQDVLLALSKFENNTYGYCEKTGDPIPIEKLAVLPTARTADDFYYPAHLKRKPFHIGNPEIMHMIRRCMSDSVCLHALMICLYSGIFY